MIGCAAGAAGVGVQGYLYFTKNLPGVEKLKNYKPPIVTQVYASNGDLIAEFAMQKRYVVPIEQIPQRLRDAFKAAEDKNFMDHGGLDYAAIVSAIVDNLRPGGPLRGASTITQQVAKTFFLTPEKTIERKIKEAILSRRIEKARTKDQILHLYLNQIYLGSSAYGVEAAARIYFGKRVQDLTIAECAMIAGLTKAPSMYSPKRNMKRALERRAYVLKRMLEDGAITREEHDAAMREKPVLVETVDHYKEIVPQFSEHVRRYLVNKYGVDAVTKDGLQVYTTVDIDMTRAAEKSVENGLEELDHRQGYRGPLKRLTVQGVVEFLTEKTKAMNEPLRFGDVTEGVVTGVDNRYVYVRMGSYITDETKKEYVGRIPIDPETDWWVRRPYVRADVRTVNFAEGDLPFKVGDLILVRLIDPNVRRRELYLKKHGRKDPEMKNYNHLSEEDLEWFPLSVHQEPIAEAAIMLRENRTGYVRVLLGGRNFDEAKYNRAVQARRQPGSSFKPVIYAAALNKGFTCADMILDSPLALSIAGTGEVWRPKNYRGGYQGPVSFREAIVKSRNIPTIKILQQIGIDHAKAYARKMGYTSRLANNLTMALGSTGVSLEEQINAYSVFPNRGYLIPSVYVTKVVDRNGKVLEEHLPPVLLDDPAQMDRPSFQRVSHAPERSPGASETHGKGASFLRRRIDDATAYIMTDLLRDVVQNGTATILKKILGRSDLAGKTGTTNENVDAWFMGFTPDFTCGVWVGFDDEHTLGEGETGGKAAAPIWGYFMRQVLANMPEKEFPESKAVEYRRIDPRTGLVAATAGGGYEEVFKMGSGPAELLEPRLIKGARFGYSGAELDQF